MVKPDQRKWSVWVDYPSRVVNCEEMELESAKRMDIDSIQDFDALVPPTLHTSRAPRASK
jgi:hypothetical protein